MEFAIGLRKCTFLKVGSVWAAGESMKLSFISMMVSSDKKKKTMIFNENVIDEFEY